MANLRQKLREIAELETNLNGYLREKEVLDQNYNTRKDQLIQLSQRAPSFEQGTELIREMMTLNSEWRRASDRLNNQIYYTREIINSKRRHL